MTTITSQLVNSNPMLSRSKSPSTATISVIIGIMAFFVSAWAVNTFLSYILPRVFPEPQRSDIYEMPSPDTWIIGMKHSVPLALSVWAGFSIGRYALGPRLSKATSKVESLMTAYKDGLPCPFCQQDILFWEREEQAVEKESMELGTGQAITEENAE